MKNSTLAFLTLLITSSAWAMTDNLDRLSDQVIDQKLGQVRKVVTRDEVRLEISLDSGPYLIITDRSRLIENKSKQLTGDKLNALLEDLRKPYTGWHPEALDLEFKEAAQRIVDTQLKERCDLQTLMQTVEESYGSLPVSAEIDVTFKTAHEKNCIFR